MSTDSKRDWRKRVYAMVTLGLVCVVGLVAMSSMLVRGHDVMNRKVYKFPLKTLMALTNAQNRFRRKDLDGDGQLDYAGSLTELEEAGTITGTLADGHVGEYRYQVLRASAGDYAIVATPAHLLLRPTRQLVVILDIPIRRE